MPAEPCFISGSPTISILLHTICSEWVNSEVSMYDEKTIQVGRLHEYLTIESVLIHVILHVKNIKQVFLWLLISFLRS